MIPLTTIFEHIRKTLKYQKNQLAEHLGISITALNYHLTNKHIPPSLMKPWATFLDFGEQDLPYLRQYNERQKIYRNLPDITQTDRNNIASLLIYFWNDLSEESQTRIKSTIHKEVLPLMFLQSSRMQDALVQLCQTSSRTTN